MLFGEFYRHETHETSSPVAPELFDDALRLLVKQGYLFLYDKLIILQPGFITEVMKPLLNHTLTIEEVTSDKYKNRCIIPFLEQSACKSDSGKLVDGLKRFIKHGELCPDVRNLLWWDTELERVDYKSIEDLFVESQIIFRSDNISVVLFRLPEEKDAEAMSKEWPMETPRHMQERELRIKMTTGCPDLLAAQFAARARNYGRCRYAWIHGTIVEQSDGRWIRVEFERVDDEQCLVFAVREVVRRGESGGTDAHNLLNSAIEFIEEQRCEVWPGLLPSPRLRCPHCDSSHKGKSHDIAWADIRADGKADCLTCDAFVETGLVPKGSYDVKIDTERPKRTVLLLAASPRNKPPLQVGREVEHNQGCTKPRYQG